MLIYVVGVVVGVGVGVGVVVVVVGVVMYNFVSMVFFFRPLSPTPLKV